MLPKKPPSKITKMVSHRGLVSKKSQQNKVLAFKNAYDRGLRAIEFDIWYLKTKLVLHHNRPKNINNLDQIDDLFLSLKNKVEYWIDFKNLNLKNCDLAMTKLKEAINNNKIKLNNLYFAPFITDLCKAKSIYELIKIHFGNRVNIVAVVEELLPENYQKFYKDLKDLNIKILSIQYQNINQKFINVFLGIKIFAWTVNDQKIADFLTKIGVKNIVSDVLIPNQNNED
jgi:glycerophosphoryl diester phosphodiesterase